MVVMVVLLAINFYKYNRYNPDENNDPFYCFKVLLYLAVYLVKYVAVCMFLWTFCLSAYCFCFYKFQETVFLILPNSGDFNKMFEAFYYTTLSFTLVAMLIMAFNLVTRTDYFLIDWEKEKDIGKFELGKNKKEASVWRKVLLVNELYELTVARMMNIEVVVLVSLLFLEGLDWMNLDFQVPNTANLSRDDKLVSNRVLSYFLITFFTLASAYLQLSTLASS